MAIGCESRDFAIPDVSPRSILDLSLKINKSESEANIHDGFGATYLSNEHDRKEVEHPFAKLCVMRTIFL